jgi:hypothetical protein
LIHFELFKFLKDHSASEAILTPIPFHCGRGCVRWWCVGWANATSCAQVIGKAQHQGKPKALRRLRDEVELAISSPVTTFAFSRKTLYHQGQEVCCV